MKHANYKKIGILGRKLGIISSRKVKLSLLNAMQTTNYKITVKILL